VPAADLALHARAKSPQDAKAQVDELCLSIAPVVLGAGKPLFAGSLELNFEPLEVYQSRWATHVRYAVTR
jgi:dihydrofolate reductase